MELKATRVHINKHEIPLKKPSDHPTNNKIFTINKKNKAANSLSINTKNSKDKLISDSFRNNTNYC